MRSAQFVLMSCALVAAVASGSAQTQVPARDVRVTAVAPRGTADLTVIVSTADQPGEPLSRAIVTMQAGELDIPYIGLSDDQGRVVFRELAAGNYLLTASKPGFVRTYYGSTQPGRGPGVAVTVLEGQHVSGIRMRVLHGSVITGVLSNAAGRPAANQSVRAIPVRAVGGERRAVNASESANLFAMDNQNAIALVTTDDRGVYRIFGLAPGDYLVSVPAIGVSTQEVRQMAAAELEWADKTVAAGTPAGGMAAADAPPGSPTVAYSPVYYPGTTVPADATLITLGPDEVRSGVDFALQLLPTAQVQGRLIDASGRPQGSVSVSLKPTRPDGLDLFASLMNGSGRTQQDGTFTIQGVKPGQYTLAARAAVRDPAAAPPDAAELRQQAIASVMGGGGSGMTHWASEEIGVNGRDVTDVTLTLRPGSTISGRIVYDATTKTPPADLSKTQVSITTASGSGGSPTDVLSNMTGGGGNIGATVAQDGTFKVSGVPPGRYRLMTQQGLIALPVQNLAIGGWMLKSAMTGGRDMVDSPIDVKSGEDVTGVVVTFTDHPAELSGTVYDPAGRVTPNFPIVVFSTDRGYWTPSSRRVVTARPASDGKFKVTGLPAGEYYVCAVTAVSRTEVYDPAFLDALVPVAFKITIADGEKKTQDLRLGGGLVY